MSDIEDSAQDELAQFGPEFVQRVIARTKEKLALMSLYAAGSRVPAERSRWGEGPEIFGGKNFRVYIGHTWSILSTEQQAEMRRVLESVKGCLIERDLNPVICIEEFPPESSVRAPGQIWPAMRRLISNCQLMVLVYSDRSEGAGLELSIANEYMVPSIFLVLEGKTLGPTLQGPALKSLGQLTYRGPDDAGRALSRFLDTKADLVQREVGRSAHIREHARKPALIARMIQRALADRGETVDDLARLVGLPKAELLRLRDGAEENPPWLHIVAILNLLELNPEDIAAPREEAEPERGPERTALKARSRRRP